MLRYPANWEAGTGDIDFSFNLNGSDYTLTIPMMYDWYDTNTLDTLHQIINAHSTENRLYAASDSGQGILLLYRTSEWASDFNRLTGIALFEQLSDLWNNWPY